MLLIFNKCTQVLPQHYKYLHKKDSNVQVISFFPQMAPTHGFIMLIT